MKKKVSILLSTLIISSIIFSGCGSKPAEEVTVTEVDSIIPTFEEYEVPDIEYEYEEESEIEESEVEEAAIPATSEKTEYNAETGPVILHYEGKSQDTNFSSMNIYQINIQTGERKELFSLTNELVEKTNLADHYKYGLTNYTGGDCLMNYVGRQLFDTNIERIAVNWKVPEDESMHVGWIDKDGNLTDITQIIHPASEGFSSLVPKDENALFSPEGLFFYYDGNDEKYHYIDVTTCRQVKEEPKVEDAYRAMFLPDGSVGENARSYSGAFHTINLTDKRISVDLQSFKQFETEDFQMVDGNLSAVALERSENRLILYGDGYSQGTDKYGVYCLNNVDTDGRIITPKTDYRIESATIYKNQIAFVANKGNERAIFITDDSGSAEPAKVVDLENGYDLFFWR